MRNTCVYVLVYYSQYNHITVTKYRNLLLLGNEHYSACHVGLISHKSSDFLALSSILFLPLLQTL